MGQSTPTSLHSVPFSPKAVSCFEAALPRSWLLPRLLFQESLDLGHEFRHILPGGLPHLIPVYEVLSMDEFVAHSRHERPWDFGMLLPKLH